MTLGPGLGDSDMEIDAILPNLFANQKMVKKLARLRRVVVNCGADNRFVWKSVKGIDSLLVFTPTICHKKTKFSQLPYLWEFGIFFCRKWNQKDLRDKR